MATRAKEDAPDNMRIWNAVEKTDPSHTKKVNQRGGFTAISAHYQIMQATKLFGPVGIGWGYENGPVTLLEKLVVVPVTIWHGERSNTFGPLYGSADLYDSRGKIDSDAPKKASTDGLTKGLSQLGFNADVFLGKFDDNKYVAEREREFHPPANDGAERKRPEPLAGPYTSKTALWAAVRAFDRKLRGCGDVDELDALVGLPESQELIEQLERDAPNVARTGDGLPAEFEPIIPLMAKLRTDMLAIAEQYSTPSTLTAG